MCSICGIIGKNDPELIKAMNESLAHRGPDDQGYYSDVNLELGQNRLSILDLSENGHMPMTNEEGTIWLIFNGEIYNFLKIREELSEKGHLFRSTSDTEVIIHAYEEYGEKCLEKFDGMFSFALYDKKKNIVFLARDRVGVKPLYYSLVNQMLLFASEMKAILCCQDILPELENYELKDYFKSDAKTTIKGIKEILPGHYILYSLSEIKEPKQVCYWQQPLEIMTNLNEEEMIVKLRDLFEESVKQRLVSDVPVALFLSGGVDSIIMSFFAKKNHNHRLKAFTIGTKDKNEFVAAKRAAEYLNLEFVPFLITEEEIIQTVPKAIYYLEDYDPRNVELCILNYFLAKKANEEGIKVVLCGEGADELFCGYRNFFPEFFKGGKYTQNNLQTEIIRWVKGLNSNHLKNKDRGTMAWGLELRLPYIDHLQFYQYALSINPFFKLKHGQEKYIMRKMVWSEELPLDILHQKKAYFHIESGIPYILNTYLGIEGINSLYHRKQVYKELFQKIFVEKKDYKDLKMNDYQNQFKTALKK